MQDRQSSYDKFQSDIQNLQTIVLVESKPDSNGADKVARQLTEYFDCDKFFQRGEQIMDKWHKHNTNFENFIARYKELKPSQNISQLNVLKEKQELERYIIWFQKKKDEIRRLCRDYREMRRSEPASTADLIDGLNTIQKNIVIYWNEI